jgi:hypothetical protein
MIDLPVLIISSFDSVATVYVGSMNAKSTSVFKAHDIAETMSTIHDKYAGATAYKASNKILLIGEKHYIECLNIE